MSITTNDPISRCGVALRLLAAYILFLAAIYLLQARSPLRITTDSYRLLSMAVSAYEGHGYLVEGGVDQFPVGYPLVVKTLMQSGVANSMVLVLLNLVFLIVGLSVLYRWCTAENGSFSAAMSTAFVLSSWVMIKHVTMPLTELLYFGVSWLSLYCLWLFLRQEGLRKWQWFSISAVLAYLALQCRSVGLTIVPVLAITALLHRDHSCFLSSFVNNWKRTLAYISALTLPSLLVLVIILKAGWYESQFVHQGSYFQFLLRSAEDMGILAVLLQNIAYRILEVGEVFFNLPHSRFPLLLPIHYFVGLVAWLALARGAWLLFRRRNTLPMTLYALTYSALMLVWPYHDTRFWLPLLPVMAIMLLETVEDLHNRWPAMRLVSLTYIACFFLLGLAALVFSTRISLSGREFSELYGDGSTVMTYRYAFQNGRPVDMSSVSDDQVRILRIFEPLASTEQPQRKGQHGTDHSVHCLCLPACPECPGALRRHDRAVHRQPYGLNPATSRALRDALAVGGSGLHGKAASESCCM